MPKRQPFDPSQAPADLWDDQAVQAALASRKLGRFFARYAERTGASQTDIAGCIGRTQPEVWRLIASDRTVSKVGLLTDIADGLVMPDRARLLMGLSPAAMSVQGNAAAGLMANQLPARRERAPGGQPALSRGVHPHPAEPELADDRAGLPTLVMRWLVAPPQPPPAQTNGWPRIGQIDVERLRTMRASLKALDDSHGGGVALPMALAYFRCEVAPLLRGRYSEAVAQELFDATAKLLLTIGWMAYDGGQQGAARRYMTEALRLAQRADNRVFGGRVLAAMSHQALHVGEIAEGVDLARAARLGTEHVATPKAAAMLAAMEACAQAAHGEAKLCAAALVDAERALARANGDGPGRDNWLDFDEGGLWGHAARAYRDLGQPAAARYAEQSLAHCHADHSRTRAQRNAILATAYLQRGEVEHACAVGQRVVTAAWQLQSARVDQDVAHLVRLVEPSDVPIARGFRAQARELLSAHRERRPPGSD